MWNASQRHMHHRAGGALAMRCAGVFEAPASTTSSFARRCVRRHPLCRINPAGLATLPGSGNSPRPTDRRADARRLRARHAAGHRAGLYACRNALARLAKRRDQLVLMRARRRTVAVKPGTAPWSNASAASSKSSITRSPRSRLTSARSSKPNRKSPTMHNSCARCRCGPRGLHATHRADAGTRTRRAEQAAALRAWPLNVDSGAYRGKRKIGGGASVRKPLHGRLNASRAIRFYAKRDRRRKLRVERKGGPAQHTRRCHIM